MKPGSSDVWRLLIPCALVPGGRHEVKLRLRPDNHVTFEGRCDWRVAHAHDVLSSTRVDLRNRPADLLAVSCCRLVHMLRESIRQRIEFMSVIRCDTCAAYVPSYGSLCPWEMIDPETGPTHSTKADLPFWQRIYMRGRVR